MLSKEAQEDVLLHLLCCSLHKKGRKDPFPVQGSEQYLFREQEWIQLAEIADAHKVLPLLYDTLRGIELNSGADLLLNAASIPDYVKTKLDHVTRQTVRQSYRLFYLSSQVLTLLEKHGIVSVLLKGIACASFYPVPQYRKSGDIDVLLLTPSDASSALKVLSEAGFIKRRKQEIRHHYSLMSPDRISVELHTEVVEPFDHPRVNRFLKHELLRWNEVTSVREVLGKTIPVLQRPYEAFALLIHMLQHFLRAGFGLKLLCDWAVYPWEKFTAEEQKEYLRLTKQTGTKGFSDLITLFCVQNLGLVENDFQWMKLNTELDTEAFRREVFLAEEFGHSKKERMVQLRGNGGCALVREFHHQMCLNYPKAGKCFLLWPVLWVLTLFRFLRNNRRKKIRTGAVLREAIRRSEGIKALHLFDKS